LIRESARLLQKLDAPYRTAPRSVERLEAIGILREATGQARNRLYRGDEIVRALEG
jgi:Fic family protein